MDEWPSSPTSLALNSPRRTLSLLRERRGRRAHVAISDPEERVAGFARDRGPKPGEVYGFVGSITTVIATVVYLVWAYTPEPWLHAMGITYYPSKKCDEPAKMVELMSVGLLPHFGMTLFFYPLMLFGYSFYARNPIPLSWEMTKQTPRYWALAIPAFAMVTVILGLAIYLGLNFMVTPPPTSYNTMFDEYSRDPSSIISSEDGGDEKPIEPISDIGINKINDLMFGRPVLTSSLILSYCHKFKTSCIMDVDAAGLSTLGGFLYLIYLFFAFHFFLSP